MRGQFAGSAPQERTTPSRSEPFVAAGTLVLRLHRRLRPRGRLSRAGAAPKSPMPSPDFLLTLALFQPEIPQNAGTMLRLCACLGVDAALIEPAAFPTSDRHFRRAGLDYLDHVRLARHASWRAFGEWRATRRRRLVLLSTRGGTSYVDFAFRPGDVIMVGRESAGVPEEVHAAADAALRIPMRPKMRSLNVAVAAAMVLGEALRQTGGFAEQGAEGEFS